MQHILRHVLARLEHVMMEHLVDQIHLLVVILFEIVNTLQHNDLHVLQPVEDEIGMFTIQKQS